MKSKRKRKSRYSHQCRLQAASANYSSYHNRKEARSPKKSNLVSSSTLLAVGELPRQSLCKRQVSRRTCSRTWTRYSSPWLTPSAPALTKSRYVRTLLPEKTASSPLQSRPAHIMSIDCIPARQSLYSHTRKPASPTSSFQYRRRHNILLPGVGDIQRVLPAACQYHGHVSDREISQGI